MCEYGPFHRGHARQYALIREQLPEARIVCVMSGCFTQRGMPALFSPAFRARAALDAGADLVLELPSAFAVREAEHFALGAVEILRRLGMVTHLSFGCETENLPFLQAAATLLERPTPVFTEALRASLALGKPFAAAQTDAMLACLSATQASTGEGNPDKANADAPAIRRHACSFENATSDIAPETISPSPNIPADTLARELSSPNNILGISYLRALRRLHSDILPLPVLRQGDYHADSLTSPGYPSASATRRAFLSGNITAAETACGYALNGADRHSPVALDLALLYRLRGMDKAALCALPDCTEGLENRLIQAASRATTREELLTYLKTRRYPRTRLNRLLCHSLLGITEELLEAHPLPESARLLGFRQQSVALLATLRHSDIPIVSKAADGDLSQPLYALDAHAYDLWALGAGLPAGLMFRQQVVIR